MTICNGCLRGFPDHLLLYEMGENFCPECRDTGDPVEPVEAKCTQCGYTDFCWPEHVKDFVCMDCYADNQDRLEWYP